MPLASKRLGVALVVLLAGLGLPVGAASATTLPLERHLCGDTIMHSFRLANNLGTCSGNGLNVAHANVTVDLNGHRLTGDSSGTTDGGIVIAGFDGVMIKNGVIASFAGFGILANNSSHSSLHNLKIVNCGIGVQDFSGDHDSITKDVFAHDGSGVFLTNGSDNNVVSSNGIYGGTGGISLNGASGPGANLVGNVIGSNRILGAGTTAINVGSFVEDTKIASNVTDGNNGPGIKITGGTNAVTGNVVRGNSNDGIFVSDARGTFTANQVTGNASNGIHVTGASDHVKLVKNVTSANLGNGVLLDSTISTTEVLDDVANENGADGISAQEFNARLVGNVTNFNGYPSGNADAGKFGIDAMSPITSGDHAKGNASGTVSGGHQCFPSTGCIAGSSAHPALVTCAFQPAAGSTVTLHNPVDCSVVGIQVLAKNVTLHLGRHRVSGGPSNGDEAVLISGVSGATVTGGVLAASYNGLRTFQAVHALDKASLIVDNAGPGVSTQSGDHVVIKKSIVTLSGSDAMDFAGTSHASAISNTVAGGSVGGIGHQTADHAVLVGNKVFGVAGVGIGPTIVSGAVLKHNLVLGAAFGITTDPAFLLETLTSSVVESNTAVANQASGFEFVFSSSSDHFVGNHGLANGQDGVTFDNANDDDNVLLSNTMNDNDQQGIKFAGATPTGNVLRFNVVDHNGFNGFYVSAAANVAKISANTVDDNGFKGEVVPNQDDYGINAATGTPGSGNVAKLNDNPGECRPASLC